MLKSTGFKKTVTLLLAVVALSVVCIGVLFHCLQFDDPITDEDIFYAKKILSEFNVNTTDIHQSYLSELSFIQQVQHVVLTHAVGIKPIPMCHTRNIKDVYEQKIGLCYDKSHVIEKVLKIYGFETRHISIYYYSSKYEKYWICFQPKSRTHAVTEVKTKRGWMLVDSIHAFIGISRSNEPLCLDNVRDRAFDKNPATRLDMPRAYRKMYVFVYGVYSRNGKLYAPYTFIPDYILNELKYNFNSNCSSGR